MFNVNDKVYFYSEPQDRYFPAVVFAKHLEGKEYVIKYWSNEKSWHIVHDIKEKDLSPRGSTERVDTEEMVNNPKHYNAGKFEVIDVIEDWEMNFNLGNAIKYIARCKHKGNKQQDIKKAIWYLERELGRE